MTEFPNKILLSQDRDTKEIHDFWCLKDLTDNITQEYIRVDIAEKSIKTSLLNEMIQDYLSKHLRNRELVCDFVLETGEEQGLSTNDMLHICKLSQQEKTGQVFFMFYGDDEEYDFDDLTIKEKICIVEQLQESL